MANKEKNLGNIFNYSGWFLRGSGWKPGYKRIVNWWLFAHLFIGIILSLIVQVDLTRAANSVLLPLSAIFIGLTFAWAGNANALLQSHEIDKLSQYHEGGFVEYVYIFQTAILIILMSLVFWGLAGLKVFDKLWPTPVNTIGYFVVKSILFAFSSMTLRECWHVVKGAQWLLLAKRRISHINEKRD